MARDKRPFGTIRKLPSGRYQAQYTTPEQRRVPAPHTFAARIDAEGWLYQRRVEVEAGRWNPTANVKKPKVTFGAYAGTWLAGRHVAGRPIKPRTREHYSAILEQHLMPAFGAKPVASITPKDAVSGMRPHWSTSPPCGRTPTACCGPSWRVRSTTS